MVWEYIRTALRALRDLGLASLMHVLGLAVGLACFMVSYAVLQGLRSGDTQFRNAGRIYAITQELWIGNATKSIPAFPRGAAPVADYLRTDFPRLEAVARALPVGRSVVTTGERNAFLYSAFVDPDLLRIFNFQFVAGEARDALVAGNSAVITQAAAEKLFGSRDVVGRRLSVGSANVSITGVIAGVPQPSHMGDTPQSLLRFDVLMHLSPSQLESGPPDWTDTRFMTYALLPANGLTAAAFREGLQSFSDRHMPRSQGRSRIDAVPVSAIRLSALNALTADTGLSITTSLLVLDIIVLGIACFNYAHLATALALHRSREIAMRKIVGAKRWQIALQCLLDAAFVAVLAIGVAVLFTALTIPLVSSTFELDLQQLALTAPGFWLLLIGLEVAVTLLAGAYPAFVLCRLQPVQALQSGSSRSARRYVPTLLVGLQFAATSFLLIMASVVHSENELLRRSISGLTRNSAVVITTRIGDAQMDLETFRTELQRSPYVRSVSAADELPWERGGGWHFLAARDVAAASKPIEVSANRIWYDFFDTMGLKVLAGRPFSKQHADETDIGAIVRGREQPLSIVIDRDLAARLGWSNPAEAVDKLIYRPSPAEGIPQLSLRVIGVVENGYPRLTGSGAQTNLYFLMPKLVNYPIIRINPGDVRAAIEHINTTWKNIAPHAPLEIRFMDELFAQAYATFAAMSSVAAGLTAFALLISLMGLFGMAVHVTAERWREIGVRKTLGAKPRQIFRMLLLDFSRPVVLANLIAWPFAWLAMRAYLDMFLLRTPVSPLPFIASLVATLLVAWITIAAQALRAARIPPAMILRYQ